MTTLPVRAPSVPRILLLPYQLSARAVALAGEVLDVIAEAQREAREAEKRYPFIVW